MSFDLPTVQVVVAIVGGLVVVLGTIFGWLGKSLTWISSRLGAKPQVGVIAVPAKTMVLIPVSGSNALWWHMGAVGKQPAMQIVGDLNVTNISHYDVCVMGVKLKKPKATGHAVVRAQNSKLYSSSHIIPQGGLSDLRFDFFVQPSVRKVGERFTADVAIIDQFGNEHWLKGLEFSYR